MTAVGRPGAGRGGEGDELVLTASSIATLVGGTLVGDPDTVVDAIAPLDRAGARDLTFLAFERYAAQFATTGAGVALVSPELARTQGSVPARIIVSRPHDALLRVLPRLYREPEAEPGVHPSAVVGRGARIGEGVSIGPRAVLGEGCTIGSGTTVGAGVVVGAGVAVGVKCRLLPNVVLYPGTRIGDRVAIHGGAVIGSDGFGYVYRDNAHQKIPHVGRCIIGNDVEIGANTTIDRGSISDTVIGDGTKIDNLVQVGHNVRIGRLCLIVAQAGIAGSAILEDGAVLGGQVGTKGHITIGKGAQVAGQAGVFGDVPPGETWSGYPARPHKESLRAQAALFKLTKILRPLERLLGDPGKDRER
ncbi:MAG TPA: UDP-3-O-(3-hydroxymyristoyl)glucosamine N-acyltransferase [Gemmatimonadaceae bacterium]|nr:UDP-3-O-(3-hydroxymyristoyl)glucosamine N-acyltransferase [Gemmatimonadaceae bacterium]